MIEKDHPFYYLSSLFDSKDAVFYMSKYVYTADSLLDDREVFKIAGKDLTEEFVNDLIRGLGKNQELALHSKVDMNKKVYHIPMIDFSCEGELSKNVLERMRNYLPKIIMNNLALYNSGRSFHAYSTTLMESKYFVEFLGRLLLINPKDGENVVDDRWVGHRLIGGFCSLRWSNNTAQYKSVPQRINYYSVNNLIEKEDDIYNKIIDEQYEFFS